MKRIALAALLCLNTLSASSGAAQDKPGASLKVIAAEVASQSCKAIKRRVNAVPGDAPLLLRSYDAADS